MAGWTDEMVEGLRRMWDEGLTTGEIGKRLGVSKNSIVGKVHRLKLVSRPSPIKKKEETEAAPVKEAKKVEEKKEPAPKPVEPKAAAPKPEVKKEPAPKEAPKPVVKEPIVTIKEEPITCAAPTKRADGKVGVTDLDNHTCRWPIGDPKDDNFHFCGKKVRVGQTYCEEHSAVAYVKTGKK